jgi:cellulose 1,4-beta-cellobiosidase
VAPATGGAPTAYVVEAGTWPGLADLATASTGTPATVFAAAGVANGQYYLQVRATSAVGTSAPSNVVSVRVGPAPPAVPGAPSALTASATGSSVTLSWTAPTTGGMTGTLVESAIGSPVLISHIAPTTGGTPTAYRIEAGSGPGQANLADFSTGSTATTFSATGVTDGRYYLRVRATNAGGTSPPSNETIMTVGCTAEPAPPTGLTITLNTGGAVAFRWTAATGGPTTYVLEAGSASGLRDLVVSDLGSTATTFSAAGVARGTYYLRVRAKNACGTGPVSNEVVLIVS